MFQGYLVNWICQHNKWKFTCINNVFTLQFLRTIFALFHQSWELQNRISLIWRLITRGEQALFNLEIKKKSGSSINPKIHHSKVPSSVDTSSAPYFLTMEDPLMTFETTSKGKPMVRDRNNYTYVANTSSTEVKY